jgi:hypothetical protein
VKRTIMSRERISIKTVFLEGSFAYGYQTAIVLTVTNIEIQNDGTQV